MESTSPRWQINLVDIYKSIRGGIVVGIAASYPVLLDNLHAVFSSADMTWDAPKIVLALKIAVASTIVELGRRYIVNHQPA